MPHYFKFTIGIFYFNCVKLKMSEKRRFLYFSNNSSPILKSIFLGSYRINLPDGRVQTVTYTADHENGFVADVKYEGVPQYPDEPKYKPAPKYAPAPAPHA